MAYRSEEYKGRHCDTILGCVYLLPQNQVFLKAVDL